MHIAKFVFKRLFVEMWWSRESRLNTQEDEDTLSFLLQHAEKEPASPKQFLRQTLNAHMLQK